SPSCSILPLAVEPERRMRLEPPVDFPYLVSPNGSRIRFRTGCLALVVLAVAATATKAAPLKPVDFRREILPILSGNCFLCHGPDGKTGKAGLRLDLKESALRKNDPIIVPGDRVESELIRRITSDDPDEVMPPRKSGKILTAGQVELLTRWIDQGAAWSQH